MNATAQEDEANYPTKLSNKLGYLSGVTDSADTAPTARNWKVFAELSKQLQTELDTWHEVLSKKGLTRRLNDSMHGNRTSQ